MGITKKTEKYYPKVGDVVTIDDGEPMVVTRIDKHEGVGSYGYDREYILCEEKTIRGIEGLATSEQLQTCIVGCRGMNFNLDFKKVEDIAPYEIRRVEAFQIRRKEPKIIIVWE